MNTNINFKGYAACPLKTLYLQAPSLENNPREIKAAMKELEPVAKEEGFNLLIHSGGKLYNSESIKDLSLPADDIRGFMQDSSVFLPNGEIGILKNGPNLFSNDIEEACKFAKAIDKKAINLSIPTEGGNFFIGKKENGEKYLLIGEDAVRINFTALFTGFKKAIESASEELSKETGIKRTNIYWVPQTKTEGSLDFHIDMVIRPLKYPYVLVNDPHTVIDEVEKITPENEQQKEELRSLKSKQLWHLEQKELIPTERITKKLEEQGFIPIKIPGIYWRNTTNYTNAIVHERDNGDLVYIANSSTESSDESTEPTNKFYEKFLKKPSSTVKYDELFENYIKEHVPCIKKVVFIKNHLLHKEGGIHCMMKEEPNFEKWV